MVWEVVCEVRREDGVNIPRRKCLVHIFQEKDAEPLIIAVCGGEGRNCYFDALGPLPPQPQQSL